MMDYADGLTNGN